jgi:hypothetical protein
MKAFSLKEEYGEVLEAAVSCAHDRRKREPEQP